MSAVSVFLYPVAGINSSVCPEWVCVSFKSNSLPGFTGGHVRGQHPMKRHTDINASKYTYRGVCRTNKFSTLILFDISFPHLTFGLDITKY